MPFIITFPLFFFFCKPFRYYLIFLFILFYYTQSIIYIYLPSSMFSGLRQGLKSIDFYQAVPSDLSDGTACGAFISLASIISLIVLVVMTVISHNSPRYASDLIIDHEHLQQKLKVNIDISFPRYPCSMLSLDIQNILKVHEVNVGNTIFKYNLPSGEQFIETEDRNQKKNRVKQDFTNNRGCRMKGFFYIDRVPGNFHFSCHGYADVVQQFLNEGGYRQAHKTIDLTHIIHKLEFGQIQQSRFYSPLSGFTSEKEIGQAFLGISYTYFLDIIQFNDLNTAKNLATDKYMYTVRMNEVILGNFPMVYFKYENNPITVFHYTEYPQWHQLFVRIVGIIGGIFTIATIIDGFIHSSIRFLLQKHRLGKLR